MDSGPKSAGWSRTLRVLVTVAALFFVFRYVHLSALAQALRTMRPGWFVAAICLFGCVLLVSAWRWHLVLRLTGNAVHPAATARLTLIGHFSYTILFGVLGGDTAKSAVYARWYRLPLPEVLAAAPLDRLLGFIGVMVFTLLAFAVAALSGGLPRLPLSLKWPYALVIAAILASALLLWLLRHSQPESIWKRFLRALTQGARLLFDSPRVATSGAVCGFLAQLGLGSVLALNLQAVTHSALPWAALVWTLPIILIVSGLPITVSGLGAREGAMLALLKIYGVTGHEAVAASLLTFACNLFWAAAGGWVLWHEGRLQRLNYRPPSCDQPASTISVIIPTLNESQSLSETVKRARAVPEIGEILVVDGGSSDGTPQVAARLGCRVLQTAPGRGSQMRLGASQAKGEIVLLLHADTWLPPNAGQALVACLRDPAVVGGGFWKRFRDRHPLLLGARFKCALRLYLGRRVLGDQAIFVRREALDAIGGVPDLPLMEEFVLCRRLRKLGRLALANATVITSARRFVKLGVVRTYWRMWWVTMRYRFGAAPQELARIYEKE